jgi:hypothetical protein
MMMEIEGIPPDLSAGMATAGPKNKAVRKTGEG